MCVCIGEEDGGVYVFDVVEEGGDLRVHVLCDDVGVFGWNVGVCEGDFDLAGQVYDEDLRPVAELVSH